MSFADSWYRASCALLLLTLHFSMFSFYLPLSFSLSLSCFLFLSLSLYLCPLFLSVVARHMSSDALYQIFSSWSILLFHTISFHSSYKIHQLFTDYLLRLSSSELLPLASAGACLSQPRVGLSSASIKAGPSAYTRLQKKELDHGPRTMDEPFWPLFFLASYVSSCKS